MRLGGEVLPPDLRATAMEQFKVIIEDTVNLVLYEFGGFVPSGMSRISFQSLGYDFLFDTTTKQAVLLEVNLNPGMGVMERSIICGQGMSRYDYLKSYWHGFKLNYVNDLLNVTLDAVLGIPKRPDNVWQEIKKYTSPFDKGPTLKDPFAAWASMISPTPFRQFKHRPRPKKKDKKDDKKEESKEGKTE